VDYCLVLSNSSFHQPWIGVEPAQKPGNMIYLPARNHVSVKYYLSKAVLGKTTSKKVWKKTPSQHSVEITA
jgi:hypothetical protein